MVWAAVTVLLRELWAWCLLAGQVKGWSCAQLCITSATHTSHLCGALGLPQGPGGVAVELLGSRGPVVQKCFLKGCGTLWVTEKCPVSESSVGLRSWQVLVLAGGLSMQ